MGIQLTSDQVMHMAPDSSSASAGKKLANAKHWKNMGQSSEALWGECQGSALYQVKIDLSSLTIQCSCPSRKQPCKHGLGLLLLTVTTPDTIPVQQHPEWITSWLAKRAATSKRKEKPEESKSSTTPSASQVKTAEKRLAQVKAGLVQLDLWLNDLIRNGLGSLETQPPKFWESQAAQMVDAQAPGIAMRIRRMAEIPNSGTDWPARLLTQMGQLALLTQAFSRLEQLDPNLQESIRQMVGWTLKEEEVIARGEHVSDDWLFLGQSVEERERGLVQNTWLLGSSSRRTAQITQFAFAGSPFSENYAVGSHQQVELVYWPGTQPQRALIAERKEQTEPLRTSLPGVATIQLFFEDVTTILASNPWRERFLCTLNTVIPLYDANNDQWHICDQSGVALPLTKGEYWQLLAFSGGSPVDFAAEWNGEQLLPLGILVDQHYYAL